MDASNKNGVVAAADPSGLAEAVVQFELAAEAKKCLACGCLRSTLEAISDSLPEASQPSVVRDVIAVARARLVPQKYECLGCDICHPAVALDALAAAGYAIEANICPTETVAPRAGWPPLPGSFRALRYHAPVAVCALTSDELIDPIAFAAGEAVAIVGTLQTENLGIERLVKNVAANPYIRFLIVCGADSQKAIGHLPGQSLVALAQNGVDDRRRIVGAKGKRPTLHNVDAATIAHFRAKVEVLNLVGTSDAQRVAGVVRECASRNPGPAAAIETCAITPIVGSVPTKMTSDPSGYFVLFLDRPRKVLCLEHYANTGLLTTVIEGRTAPELYMTSIERGLLSRLDHAAYLGRELARAEGAIASGEPYVQDAAPEKCGLECACHSKSRA